LIDVLNSERILLTASTDFRQLSAAAEKCLRDEGFAYIQNGTEDIVEFEVQRPVYFRIVVHRRHDAEVGNFFMQSIRAARGTFLDVWFSPDQEESRNREAVVYAKQFLRKLVSSLPEAPWQGLKFRESGKAKKKWKGLID